LDERLQWLKLDFWILQRGGDSAILLDPGCRATDVDRRSGFRGLGTSAKGARKPTLLKLPETSIVEVFERSRPPFGRNKTLRLRDRSKKG
jgi:hypothetical protein